MAEILSQKARAMHLMNWDSPCQIPQFQIFTLDMDVEEMEMNLDHIRKYWDTSRVFIRPCPETPNHGMSVGGFESVCVHRSMVKRTVLQMLESFLANNVRADIMVMEYVDAEMSAVVAPLQYAIVGKGNNGVTAGIGQTIALPMRPDDNYNFLRQVNETVDSCELEMLCNANQTYLVQVRHAPDHIRLSPAPPGAVPGFIPTPNKQVCITDRIIIRNLEDLGQLEKDDAKASIVIQPNGSLLSHASAHCRGKHIPFVVAPEESFQPGTWATEVANGWVQEGRLETDGVPTYSPTQYSEQFLAGLEEARWVWSLEWSQLGGFFHQFASRPLVDPALCARLAGGYIGWLVMASLLACTAEARHVRRHRSARATIRRTMALIQRLVRTNAGDTDSRSFIYAKMEEVTYDWSQVAVITDFLNQRCFRAFEWGHGYGGKKWGDCAKLTTELCKAIVSKDVMEILIAANALENAAHNGGWLFNKFTSEETFAASTHGFSIHYIVHAFGAARQAFKVIDNGLPTKEIFDLSDLISDIKKGRLIHAEAGQTQEEAIKQLASSMVEQEIVVAGVWS